MNLNKQLNEHEKIKVIKTLNSLAFAIEIRGGDRKKFDF
jgi:hypothetical protein